MKTPDPREDRVTRLLRQSVLTLLFCVVYLVLSIPFPFGDATTKGVAIGSLTGLMGIILTVLANRKDR